MQPADEKNMLTFEQFCEAVGARPYSVRMALRDLGKKAIPLFSDRRQTRYRPEWVSEVKQWLLDHIYE